ncbi:MAG TPA: hypothetical protein PLB46_12860 [Chitinophagales bacterium]|nr:hypothetical protein [Chitinophagales bacterium]
MLRVFPFLATGLLNVFLILGLSYDFAFDYRVHDAYFTLSNGHALFIFAIIASYFITFIWYVKFTIKLHYFYLWLLSALILIFIVVLPSSFGFDIQELENIPNRKIKYLTFFNFIVQFKLFIFLQLCVNIYILHEVDKKYNNKSSVYKN